MGKKQWYETLFENYGQKYDQESFTQGTLGECDFIEKEIGHDSSKRILDVGCGTGRHALELSRRGYQLTGIDLSENLLKIARKKAADEGLKTRFLHHDARKLPFNKQFDVAIMLCEGGFPLMETDEMNYDILKNVSNALKDEAIFIFTTLNGLFPLFNSLNEFYETNGKEGDATYDSQQFDLLTFRDYNTTRFVDDDGKTYDLECNERYYVPPEITWLLKTLGFTDISIFGAKLGAFSRNDQLKTDDFEMLVIAKR